MRPGHMAYDRAITVFSPDGRLFQVEYAREAVKRGTTAVGMVFKDGVVLATDKRVGSRLIEAKSIEKIFEVDEHMGCATSGLVADARILVDKARVEAQINKIYYDEKIPVEILVKNICDYKQRYTQFGAVRPFGTAMLVAGIDEEVHLFETDPSGALAAYKAGAIGEGRSTALRLFEEKYKEGLTDEEAIMLCLQALYKATEGALNPIALEIGIIKKGEKFRKLTLEEIKKYMQQLK